MQRNGQNLRTQKIGGALKWYDNTYLVYAKLLVGYMPCSGCLECDLGKLRMSSLPHVLHKVASLLR
jgi:hypothetical protein